MYREYQLAETEGNICIADDIADLLYRYNISYITIYNITIYIAVEDGDEICI